MPLRIPFHLRIMFLAKEEWTFQEDRIFIREDASFNQSNYRS